MYNTCKLSRKLTTKQAAYRGWCQVCKEMRKTGRCPVQAAAEKVGGLNA